MIEPVNIFAEAVPGDIYPIVDTRHQKWHFTTGTDDGLNDVPVLMQAAGYQ